MNKEKKVYFGGDTSYKEIVSAFLSKCSTYIEVSKINDADLIYWVYGNGPAFNFKNFTFWIKNNKKFILHWIGTDVLTHISKLRSTKLKSRLYYGIWNRLILRKVKRRSMVNLCCAPWLCEELAEIGIPSTYLPLTTIKKEKFDFHESERGYDFMSYLPQGRMNLYNGEEVIKVASKMNIYRFILVIPDINSINELALKQIPDNITIIPRVDFEKMTDIYRNSKCFLRFTKHDGLSLSVIEAMANRMQVFWTYKYPNVHYVNLADRDNLLNLLYNTIENWKPNFEGQSYVLNNLNIHEIELKFLPIFQQLYDYNN